MHGCNPSNGSGVLADTAAQSNGAIGRAEDRAVRRMLGGPDMGQRFNWKAVANEKEYPYIVELVIAGDKLDVGSRRRKSVRIEGSQAQRML